MDSDHTSFKDWLQSQVKVCIMAGGSGINGFQGPPWARRASLMATTVNWDFTFCMIPLRHKHSTSQNMLRQMPAFRVSQTCVLMVMKSPSLETMSDLLKVPLKVSYVTKKKIIKSPYTALLHFLSSILRLPGMELSVEENITWEYGSSNNWRNVLVMLIRKQEQSKWVCTVEWFKLGFYEIL